MHAELLTLYHALRDLARRQLDALAAEDMDAFIQATADRDRAFERVQARHADVVGLAPDERAAIQGVADQILANDAKLQELLATTSARTQAELNRLQQGLTALDAYGSEADRPALFIDRSS